MQKKNQKSAKTPSKKTFIVGGALALIIIAQIVTGSIVYHLVTQQQIQANRHFGDMIMLAATNVNQPVPVDAKTGNVYFSDARLSLPPVPNTLWRLAYQYIPEATGTHFELHIASVSDIDRTGVPLQSADERSPEKFKSKIPKLQACVKGVTMSYYQQQGLTPSASKVLANGKTLYFYYEPECANHTLNQYLLNIQSY